MAIPSVLSAAVLALSTASRTPATLYVSPTRFDTSPYTATHRFELSTARTAATPGGAIQLAAGSYPSHTIAVDRTKAAATHDVVIRPASDASVTLGYLTIRGLIPPWPG